MIPIKDILVDDIQIKQDVLKYLNNLYFEMFTISLSEQSDQNLQYVTIKVKIINMFLFYIFYILCFYVLFLELQN